MKPALKPILFGAPFDPRQIVGLKLWLAADRISGLADGAAVSNWLDLSGVGNNAVQATGGKQPLYKVNILNGRPAVRFDGTDDVLVTPGLGIANGDYTIFNVSKSSLTGAVFSQGRASSNTPFVLIDHVSTGKRRFNHRSDASAEVSGGVFDVNAANGSFYVHTVQRSGTTFTQRVNTTATNATATIGATTTDQGAVGANKGLTESLFFNGDVAELICFVGSLSAADVSKVENYLNQRYALY